ncbi:hypothetical protein KP509_04G056200 [Ceratopteris richardii]|uniref:Uncharacterized protein n=1 Tax=Ceratopteris richardii TaxID=49495 RepID=A0A8T2UZG2_CERRI|nr:hypothetical protein KP509_04G056200 [Ceratopteris richardii]
MTARKSQGHSDILHLLLQMGHDPEFHKDQGSMDRTLDVSEHIHITCSTEVPSDGKPQKPDSYNVALNESHTLLPPHLSKRSNYESCSSSGESQKLESFHVACHEIQTPLVPNVSRRSSPDICLSGGKLQKLHSSHASFKETQTPSLPNLSRRPRSPNRCPTSLADISNKDKELISTIMETSTIPGKEKFVDLDKRIRHWFYIFFRAEQPLCPECHKNEYVSFRYFNNMNKSKHLQPRYVCKSPWHAGGKQKAFSHPMFSKIISGKENNQETEFISRKGDRLVLDRQCQQSADLE